MPFVIRRDYLRDAADRAGVRSFSA